MQWYGFALTLHIQYVGVVSRFLANQGKEHWDAIKWIFRYIKGSNNYCLFFQGTNTLSE